MTKRTSSLSCLVLPNSKANGPIPKDEGASRSGTVRVGSADGSLLQERDKLALCRCGGISNPPFCDGTHRKIGYRSKR